MDKTLQIFVVLREKRAEKLEISLSVSRVVLFFFLFLLLCFSGTEVKRPAEGLSHSLWGSATACGSQPGDCCPMQAGAEPLTHVLMVQPHARGIIKPPAAWPGAFGAVGGMLMLQQHPLAGCLVAVVH